MYNKICLEIYIFTHHVIYDMVIGIVQIVLHKYHVNVIKMLKEIYAVSLCCVLPNYVENRQ